MITLIISRFFQVLLAIVTTRLMTQFLSPEEVGRISLLVSVYTLIMLIFINPPNMYINRQVHEWNEKKIIQSRFIQYFGYIIFIGGFAGGICWGLQKELNIINNIESIWIFTLIYGVIIGFSSNQVITSSLNLLGSRSLFASFAVMTIAISLVCSVLLIFSYKKTAEFWLLGQIVGQLTVAIFAWILFNRRYTGTNSVNLSLSFDDLKDIGRFTGPLALSTCLFWVQMQSYRFILDAKVDLAMVGLFVAGYNVAASIIGTLENLLAQYLQPNFYYKASDGNIENQRLAWERYTNLMFPSLILTIIFIGSTGQYLVKVLLGNNFQVAAQFVVWGALAESLRVVAGTYTLIAHVRKNTKVLILSHITGAVLALTLGWLLIPEYRGLGAGIALISAGLVAVIMLHFSLSRIIKINIQTTAIKRACVLGMPMIFAMLGIKYLSGNTEPNLLITFVALLCGSLIYFLGQYVIFRSFLNADGS